jgi:PAS domain S-box-containing protein
MNSTIVAKVLTALAIALILLGTLGVLAYQTIGRLMEDNAQVLRSNAILLELAEVRGALLHAESEARAFLIAGRAGSIGSHREAAASARRHLANLREKAGGDLGRLDRLEQAVSARLDELNRVMALAATEGYEAARRQIDRNPGELSTSEIDAALAEYRSIEQGLHQDRARESAGSTRRAMLAFTALMGLFLALLASLTYMIRRELGERRRVADELRAQRERFELAVAGSRDGLWDWDTRTNVVYFSPRWKAQLGLEEDELTGRFEDWESRLHPDDRERALATVSAYHEGRLSVYELEHRLRHKDGSYRWILARGVALRDERGEPYRMAGSHTDITARKEAEARLAEQNRLLEEAARAAQAAHEALKRAQSRMVQAEKLASLGQMVAGVAHEINNPLAFVINNLAVLRRDVQGLSRLVELYREGGSLLADRAPELASRIGAHADAIDLPYTLGNVTAILDRSRDGLKRIEGIVSNLRDFARLDEGEWKEIDLNAGIASTAEILRAHAHRRGVGLNLKLDPLPSVLCHPGKINQVVLNLVSNAIDACRQGGQVSVHTQPVADAVELHVCDTGSGIAPDVLPKIFDPFFTTKSVGQGTGLGLSISYGIVQEHGGRIEVESSPGRGAQFTVTLPLRPPRPAG